MLEKGMVPVVKITKDQIKRGKENFIQTMKIVLRALAPKYFLIV